MAKVYRQRASVAPHSKAANRPGFTIKVDKNILLGFERDPRAPRGNLETIHAARTLMQEAAKGIEPCVPV